MDLKDKWINKVENSVDGISRPDVNPYLFEKVATRLQTFPVVDVKPGFIWASAISFILLIIINVMVVNAGAVSSKPESEATQLSKALHLMNENAINYN